MTVEFLIIFAKILINASAAALGISAQVWIYGVWIQKITANKWLLNWAPLPDFTFPGMPNKLKLRHWATVWAVMLVNHPWFKIWNLLLPWNNLPSGTVNGNCQITHSTCFCSIGDVLWDLMLHLGNLPYFERSLCIYGVHFWPWTETKLFLIQNLVSRSNTFQSLTGTTLSSSFHFLLFR